MSHHPKLATKILNYWHKVEFFESADIEELAEGKQGVIPYRLDELIDAPDCLPWLNKQQVRRAGHGYFPDKDYNFTLYFGIFARSEIFSKAKEAFPEAAQGNEEQNQDEGRSCSIKIFVDREGIIARDSFEFSTVPWALGQLQAGQLDNIHLQTYTQETALLLNSLLRVVTVADNIKQEHGLPPVLTTFEIIEFLKAMAVWTEFSPEVDVSSPALIVQVSPAQQRKDQTQPPRIDLHLLPNLASLPERITAGDESRGKEANHEGEQPAPAEVNILNSFYIRDIERVMSHINRHGISSQEPISRYLAGLTDKKPDLLTPSGRSLLIEQLRLNKLPSGRWPGEDANVMSMMQQFAINTIEDELSNVGLYSVNGPPGTGKTTMLRDLVANNLVKRAEVLAQLPSPSAAFGSDLPIRVNDSLKTLKRLIPELTGFEMVVVSNNNAAVENISKELPQVSTLGQAYREMSYLKTVAQKLAADHEGSADRQKKTVKPLTTRTDCWGLVAAALGNQKNRGVFGERVFFNKIESCNAEEPANTYRTLVAAIHQLAAGGNPAKLFSDAQTAFITAKEKVSTVMADLSRLEGLILQEARCQALVKKVARSELRILQLQARLAKCLERMPRWWQFRIKPWCRWRAIHHGLSLRLAKESAQHKLEQHQSRTLTQTLALEQHACAPLKNQYAELVFADDQTDLESPAVQRKAFGQCLALNQARANLTVKAVALHEAWLVAAYKDKAVGLSDSVFMLMDAINGKVPDPDATKVIWQLLFMIVPVVSSTFASVARQFGAFTAGEIGWLFIDEAGQATPQQAVGGLWRAKRAVVVGDPLQVEPVFTIPPAFVEVLAKREFGEQWYQWSPTVTSVQILADRANPYGTGQIAPGQWLGSPLRVHRRCNDPMFSIANTIAYNGKMLHGSDHPRDDSDFIWGQSDWLDIGGPVEGKHFVPAQAKQVLSMLGDYIEQYHELPDVYIISPFKRVKSGISAYLRKELGKLRFKGQADLHIWLRNRIGTVHTFQGKEEKNVIFVLGLDSDNPGAANWASSKPNLLNVAVTRAQKHLYIVGSKTIWSGCKYFSDANTLLLKTKSSVYADEDTTTH